MKQDGVIKFNCTWIKSSVQQKLSKSIYKHLYTEVNYNTMSFFKTCSD